MARPLRLEFAGALYHVTSRGDGRESIYLDDGDRERYLDVLAQVCERFNWVCHAYCLMGNHYHLLIETPDGNLSKGMRHLNGVYTQCFNRAHRRMGHVFQGRFKAILVQKENYLLEVARYIVLNPVRAQMIRAAVEWPWSSYRATAGMIDAPNWLTTDWLLSAFDQRRSAAIEAYKLFVTRGAGQPSPWIELKNQIFLGDDQFVEASQRQVDLDRDLREIPKSQRRRMPQPLTYYDERCEDRDAAILLAYHSGGYTLKDLGDYHGLHLSHVGRIVEREKCKT